MFLCEEEGPKLTCINLIDREGMTEMIRTPERLTQYQSVDFLKPQPYQKILRIYSRDSEGNIPSIMTVYHANGQPKQYLEAINNQASGKYREWFPGGALKINANVIGGSGDITPAAEKSWLFDGSAFAYDENGILMAEIQYCKGELFGLTTHYHANGKIWKTIPYKNGVVEGTMFVFLENGQLLQKVEFRAGIKSGISKRYWSEEQLSSDEVYEQGRIISGRYTDFTGNLVAEIENGNGFRATFGKDSIGELQEYKNGVLDGEVKVFSRSGQLVKVYHVKNELKNGEEIHYYPQRIPGIQITPKMSVSWFQGIIQGVTKTWYDNGIMESQREMSENKKNGLSTAWYRDGQLMLIEEYDGGKLKRGDYYRKGEKHPISQVVEGEGIVTFYDAEGNFIKKVTYANGKPEI